MLHKDFSAPIGHKAELQQALTGPLGKNHAASCQLPMNVFGAGGAGVL